MVETDNSGKKRKRSQEEDLSAKLAGKLHHHVREVRKAAKKAKSFELQKTVKKLKGLRKTTVSSPEIADLEEQLDILKQCDHEPFANTALKTKIHKDKLLSANEDLAAAVAKELATNVVVPAAPGSNLAKVQGRILSSKIIATEVAGVVEALKMAISPGLKKEKALAAGGAEQMGEEENEDGESEGDNVPPSKKVKRVITSADAEESDEEKKSDASSRVLAFSDEDVDDAGWESGSIHDGPHSGAEDSEDDEDDEDETDPSTAARKAPKAPLASKNAKTKAGKAEKAGESTFLPSLSVGFTRGDSDASDFSDDDAGGAAPKKNRRGQRARQAIWEKKYGRNANHVKKQHDIFGKGKPGDRGTGNSAQRSGWTQDRSRPKQSPYSNSAKGSQPSQSRAPLPRIQREKKDEKPLHPSWAAKKQLKEKQNPGIVAPQGTKIVF